MKDIATSPGPDLGLYVQSFFGDYLTTQRDLSPHTVLSYRDALKLFLAFAARYRRKTVADLEFRDVGPDATLAFLDDLEKTRKCSVRTRNTRLAALHTFFRYIAQHEPRVLDTCQRIISIPVKRTSVPSVVYLEYDEVLHVLGAIDRSTALGRRDYLLVRLLFETGVRAQEIAGAHASALRLSPPCQLRVLGKGRKERSCPIRLKSAKIIRQYLEERPQSEGQDGPLFVSARGGPLTRYGVLRIVKRHVKRAAQTMPSLAAKRVGAHTFRHAAAVHLLRSGNALPVIRSWLGHASVTTTDHYTEIDMKMKQRALEATEPLPASRQRASWKRNADLLAWLEAL